MPLRAIYMPEPPAQRWGRRLLPYLAAVGVSGGTLGLTLAVPQVAQKPFFVLFFAGIGLCAWSFGVTSGLVCVCLDALALAYFVLPPLGSLAIGDSVDAIRLAIFIAMSVAIAIMAAKLKGTRRELERAHERFKLAHDIARIYCWELDVAKGKVIWSAGGEDESEFQKADIQSYFEKIHPEDVPRVMAALKNAVETHDGYEIEYRVVAPTNGVRWMASRGEFYRSEKGEQCLLGVDLDITTRKEAERSREPAAKGEMAGELAHEINNPLQSLVNSLYLVHEAAADTRLQHYTTVARSEADRVSVLVKQLLNLYRRPAT